MEFEERNEERNRKPKTTGTNTPAIVLGILFGIVVLLLYAGWNLMSDDASNITDMKSMEKIDSTDSDVVETSTPIAEEREEIVEEPEPEPAPVVTPPKPVETPAKSTYKGETAIHVVTEGETFFGIANKFNTSSDNLKALNPDVNPNGIKVGVTKIKVPVQAVHTVGPGDILRVVASKYGITLEALMAANGKKKNNAQRGEKLLIPHKKKV
ncbi:LysM peptidoglycan-binding domain-containing protein [Leadbetterella sp. DM7]|uniref:LysM peptidoglycan-binding domain-containing protein n=1 Tax=Leadbetterella sp. DM7 TaxID=3235085 RepID=UPI00349EFAE0